MLYIESLLDDKKCIDGLWVVARPLTASLMNRIKDAWQVILGKADAVTFYKQ